MVKAMGPLIRLLQNCASNEKQAIGYVYDGMYRARKGIKELFKERNTCTSLILPFSSSGGVGHNVHGFMSWQTS